MITAGLIAKIYAYAALTLTLSQPTKEGIIGRNLGQSP
jgi:hypothetical protein